MNDPVIVSIVRTPLGRFGGSLKDVPAIKLGSLVISESIRRACISTDDVDEVIMGMVLQAGQGQNPARQAAIGAGIPVSRGSMTINKVCGSGLKSIMIAANSIKVGEHDIIVAGGMENMALAPYYLYKARNGYRMGDGKLVDGMVYDGLWEIYNDFHMGITGERIAEHYGLSREEVDRFAVRSHELAAAATENGKFKAEIVPVEIPQRRGDPIVFEKDEGIRADSTVEKLARLRPVFKKDGLVTAGNASQISDGASAAVVMSRQKAEELGISVLAKIIDYHTSGCAPEDVMEAPVPTVREILGKTNMSIADMDLIEHNEAFASASLAIQREFDIPEEKFNVHGGAVALGHPIGASGARVLTTLIYALKDKKLKRGLATLCLGGGNAVAMIIEV